MAEDKPKNEQETPIFDFIVSSVKSLIDAIAGFIVQSWK
jgi:hypothetical protein